MQVLVERSGEAGCLARVPALATASPRDLDAAELAERVGTAAATLRQKAQGRRWPPRRPGGDADRIVASAERTLGLYHVPPAARSAEATGVHVRNPALRRTTTAIDSRPTVWDPYPFRATGAQGQSPVSARPRLEVAVLGGGSWTTLV